jgi:hypothetical protein
MVEDPQTDPDAVEPDANSNEESYVAAYDLDGDGEVSPVEDARGFLGLADARLEQVANEGGTRGKVAGAAHRLVDRLDND